MDLVPAFGWWAFYDDSPWRTERIFAFSVVPGPVQPTPIVLDLHGKLVTAIPDGLLHEDLIEQFVGGVSFSDPLWLQHLINFRQDLVTAQVV